MPAGYPGDSPANNQGNPTLGNFILMDPLSGPKGSPFSNDKDYANATAFFPTSTGAATNLNCSTGALATGIGFGAQDGPFAAGIAFRSGGSLLGFAGGNYTDDYTLGLTKPDGTSAADSTYLYIGGGKSTKNVDGKAPEVPYVAGFAILGGGNGASRDAGAGPAFTGFALKTVTAVGTVANGAAVETNWANRSGASITVGQSVFGSGTVATAAPS